MNETLYEIEIRPIVNFDMAEIWGYTRNNWSLSQADKYILNINDAITRLRSDPFLYPEHALQKQSVRLMNEKSHIIIFTINKNTITILRVVHKSRNWKVLLSDE